MKISKDIVMSAEIRIPAISGISHTYAANIVHLLLTILAAAKQGKVNRFSFNFARFITLSVRFH